MYQRILNIIKNNYVLKEIIIKLFYSKIFNYYQLKFKQFEDSLHEDEFNAKQLQS